MDGHLRPGRLLLPLLLLLAGQLQAEVTIDAPGAEDALMTNLLARLGLEGTACDAPAWHIRRLFNRAEKDFQPALRAFGYYQAKVEKELEIGGDCWQATFVIELGQRVEIRKRTVSVEGDAAADKQLKPLLSALPLAVGEPLNHGHYEDIKSSLRDFATRRGYFDFTLMRNELRVFPDEAAAEVDIEAESGPRYRFGELRINEVPLNDDFVRRLARAQEGEPYDLRVLIAMDRNLTDPGYFRLVQVRALREESEDESVPVEVQLEMAQKHAWSFGVGYATDTGPRGTIGYENRYVNPKGHRFRSALQLSPIKSSLRGDYVIPGQNPHRETFAIGARLEHEDNDSAESDSASLIGSQTLKSKRWTQTRFIELLHERSKVGDEDWITDTLWMPGIGLDHIKADNPLQTRKGYRINFEVRGAHEALFSTTSLMQLRAGAKGIYRFGEGGRITARVDGGTTLTDSIRDLPASLRFFAGGDNSVRGYKYKSLGPEDSDGEPKGGRHMLTGSLEYEHPVKADDWWLATFVDAGNAFDFDDVDAKVGYGVGVRWYSPVGRLRLDIAFPEDTERDSWRLHFGIGADL
jgi:translocation and assembly module TamA